MSRDIEDLVRDVAGEGNYYPQRKDYDNAMKAARRRYKMCPSKVEMKDVYQRLIDEGEIPPNQSYEFWGLKRFVRSASGVLVVTVFTPEYYEDTSGDTSGDGIQGDSSKVKRRFDCAYDCHYCPSEPGHPRSYLSTEPGVMRSIECDYDVMKQFDSRLNGLVRIGHTPDKLEILVLGGTWSSYPMSFRESFIRDIYYAANTWFVRNKVDVDTEMGDLVRSKESLEMERKYNEMSKGNRIIGVTLETRPDCVNVSELRHFRRCGCTRVQIGVQHTDDSVLRKVNRRCYTRHTIRAIRLLKEAGFKVDIHLMPDLPGSSVNLDRSMFKRMLTDPDLQADQWKIYPTSVTPWTKIEEWYREGSYQPYAEIDDGQLLMELLIEVMTQVHPWIRLNRVIRDIPERSIIGGNKTSHLRDVIDSEMKKRGLRCRDIRAREVRDHYGPGQLGQMELVVRQYQASGGEEYYLSFEDSDEILYGQLRLRFNANRGMAVGFEELRGCALIRELHVYGQLVAVGSGSDHGKAQHLGLGRRLLEKAVSIAMEKGYSRLAVISGDGVKDYYRRYGFVESGDYLILDVSNGKSVLIRWVWWKDYRVWAGIFLLMGLILAWILKSFEKMCLHNEAIFSN